MHERHSIRVMAGRVMAGLGSPSRPVRTGATTARALLEWGQRRLLATGLVENATEARQEAQTLLCHVMRVDRSALYLGLNDTVEPSLAATYLAELSRRVAGEPVAYIVGEREFYGLSFFVDSRVLIPRPETELLVELVLERVKTVQNPRIVDVGCGSGCIAVAVAVHREDALVYATDASEGALEVARLNAARHQVSQRVRFLHGDLLAPLPEPVDVVAANLPYVNQADLSALPVSIREYEPRLALDGGTDGLGVIRRLFDQAAGYLRGGGCLLVEIAYDQAEAATRMAGCFFPTAQVRTHADLGGVQRVVEVSLPPVGPGDSGSTIG